MRPLELEIWVLRALDQATRHSHVEDSLVELKSEWPTPATAARQIAAHANSARGAPILWIIGVDEAKGVTGASPMELANWFSSVISYFDDVHPQLQDLNVKVGEQTVVALLFQTDRAPFVVKNSVFGTQGGGAVEWEIPWREGRKTRTANRESLLRLLGPMIRSPEIECLNCSVCGRTEKTSEGVDVHRWYVDGVLYVVPSDSQTLVVPFHRCHLAVTLGEGAVIGTWSELRLSPPRRMSFSHSGGEAKLSSFVDSKTIDSSSSELVIKGPGRVTIAAQTTHTLGSLPACATVSVSLHITAVGIASPSAVQISLLAAKPDKDMIAKWTFQSATP